MVRSQGILPYTDAWDPTVLPVSTKDQSFAEPTDIVQKDIEHHIVLDKLIPALPVEVVHQVCVSLITLEPPTILMCGTLTDSVICAPSHALRSG
jgi:hypothetical protein